MLFGRAPALRSACALLLQRGASKDAAVQSRLTGVKSFEEMPGPKPLPVIGNAWRFMPGIGEFRTMDMKDQQEKFYRTYGDIMRLVGIPGRRDMVFVYNPEDIEKLFRNEGPWPVRESTRSIQYYREVARRDLFKGVGGLTVAQGEEWQIFRSKVNQQVMQPRSAKLYVGIIQQVAEEFVHRMATLLDGNQELPDNFVEELNKWALESIATIVLDTRLGCLSDNLAPDSEQIKIIEAVKIVLDSIFLLDIQASLWKYVSTPSWRRMVKSMDLFNELVIKYINQAMDRMKKEPHDDGREFSILERLLLNNDTPMVACVMALDMIFAGVDTTAITAGTVLYYLATNQDKQRLLFDEIERELPEGEPITAERLNEMRYLRACTKETLRMSSVSTFNIRTLSNDIVLGGYHIPKGVEVLTCHNLLCNLEEYFPQADRFIPERFLKGHELQHSAHPFVYLPFGFGVRMCVGRRFAELEMEMLIIQIVRKFRLEYHHGPMKFRTTVLYAPVSPLRFKLLPRT